MIIASVPVSLSTASNNMRSNGSSYWTPVSIDAKTLVISASGGVYNNGMPEIDRDYRGNPLKGYYWHYHCLNKSCFGAHSWFGAPYGNVF